MGDLVAGIRDAERELARPGWRILGAIGYLAFDVAVLWATFRALGVSLPPGALTLGYLLGYVANVMPIPAGIGVLDGGLTAALVFYGAPGHLSLTEFTKNRSHITIFYQDLYNER